MSQKIYAEIKQVGYELKIVNDELPKQFSSGIPIKIIKSEEYTDWLMIPFIFQYNGENLPSSGRNDGFPLEYDNETGITVLPKEAFEKCQNLFLSVSLTNYSTEETIYLSPVKFNISGTLSGDGLIDNNTWEISVVKFVDNYMKMHYVSVMDDLIAQATNLLNDSNNLHETVTNQQNTINGLIKTTQDLQKNTTQLQTNVNSLVDNINDKLANGEFTPNVSVGTTETVTPTTPASVLQSGTKKDPIFSFKIPKGNTGATGNGVASIVQYYQVSTSSTTAPTTWLTTKPSLTVTNKYLWMYEKITYTNKTTLETVKRVVGAYGDTGLQGASVLYGNGVPANTLGRNGDSYINVAKSETYPYYLFTKDNNVWTPRVSVQGVDGTDTLPIYATAFLPADETIPSGYGEANEYYIPASCIGLDDNTPLPSLLDQLTEAIRGMAFYCGEEDGAILIGNYDEWVAKGKPVMVNAQSIVEE